MINILFIISLCYITDARLSLKKYDTELNTNKLSPVFVSPAVITEFSLDSKQGSLVSDQIINKFQKANINHDKFKNFLKTVDLAQGLNGEHKTISYVDEITIGIAKKEMYGIKINIRENVVYVWHKSITLTQVLPTLYNRHTSCSRGDRKYVLFGPKEQECSTSYAERGLNDNEIKLIENRLMQSYYENKNLLT